LTGGSVFHVPQLGYCTWWPLVTPSSQKLSAHLHKSNATQIQKKTVDHLDKCFPYSSMLFNLAIAYASKQIPGSCNSAPFEFSVI
jgi:hypothetical protein